MPLSARASRWKRRKPWAKRRRQSLAGEQPNCAHNVVAAAIVWPWEKKKNYKTSCLPLYDQVSVALLRMPPRKKGAERIDRNMKTRGRKEDFRFAKRKTKHRMSSERARILFGRRIMAAAARGALAGGPRDKGVREQLRVGVRRKEVDTTHTPGRRRRRHQRKEQQPRHLLLAL
ncbi:hypothetical protein HPB51_017371 [Rhipicephalus microplus]|uniref:Uncharacterized protein n=1 Tax=Rhipicephalus microplus TaxID=6941 RepID=A0A9J6DVJ6_RHIMP|nr:hypothetical protein HPB51_017371 [Rhipicephalus microplus]